MNKRPMRFGIVGVGYIAQTHIQALQQSKPALLAAVADARKEAAAEVGATCGCESFDSHQAMIAGSDLDAVIVCTPPSSHAGICTDLVKAGVHVLCEKPFSFTVDQAEGMLAAARDAGVLVTMAAKYRFVPDVIKAKELVSSGALGKVQKFENAFMGNVDMAGRWNSDPTIGGGGVIMDNGAHSVDLMRYLCGPLSKVKVSEGDRTQGLKVEESVTIEAQTADGIQGRIELSWSRDPDSPTFITLHGSEGVLSVGWKESNYRLKSASEPITFGDGYNKVRAFVGQIENFVHAARGEGELSPKPEDALASVQVVEAAYRSLAGGSWVSVEGRE